MAFSSNGNGSSGRGRFRHAGTLSEINVTPFVDVLLVLLIIFMLTANLIARQAIEVELPRAAQSTATSPTTLAVTLTREGALYLDGRATTPTALREAVRAAVARDPHTQAIIAGDKAVAHGRVVWVMKPRLMSTLARFSRWSAVSGCSARNRSSSSAARP